MIFFLLAPNEDVSGRGCRLPECQDLIIIALGSNIAAPGCGGPCETCAEAVASLQQIPGLRLVATSNWYRTMPIPQSDQPPYCNGAVRLEGEITPQALWDALVAIELRFGRQRGEPNAARTLDLDIIDLNGMIRATRPVTLPHPRAHLREFVLRPILDVAPAWEHPTFRLPVTSLLADVGPQGVAPWYLN